MHLSSKSTRNLLHRNRLVNYLIQIVYHWTNYNIQTRFVLLFKKGNPIFKIFSDIRSKEQYLKRIQYDYKSSFFRNTNAKV